VPPPPCRAAGRAAVSQAADDPAGLRAGEGEEEPAEDAAAGVLGAAGRVGDWQQWLSPAATSGRGLRAGVHGA